MQNNKALNSKRLRTAAIICSVVMLALCVMKIMPQFHIYFSRLPLLLLPIWTLLFAIAGSKMNKKLILVFPVLLLMEFVYTGLDYKLMGNGFWAATASAKTWMLWVLIYAFTFYGIGVKRPDGKPVISAQTLTVLFIVWALCGLEGISSVYKSFSAAYGCLHAVLMLPTILLATYPELAVSESESEELSKSSNTTPTKAPESKPEPAPEKPSEAAESSKPQELPKQDTGKLLAQLEELHANGILSEEEYKSKCESIKDNK